MTKKQMLSMLIITGIIVVVFLVMMYVFYNDEGETIISESHEHEIQPLLNDTTNQSVFITIHRIVKKGIIDQMFESGNKALENMLDMGEMKITSNKDRLIQSIKAGLEGLRPGFGWNKKPDYSFEMTIDDYYFNAPQDFDVWDTKYIDQTVFRDVNEGDKYADITLGITELEHKLLKKNTVETLVEEMHVQYDFETGRWTGDDSFNDSDGYGHYNGTDYEFWFSISQTSSDGDAIPWYVEKNVLHTSTEVDDSIQDPDMDGIPTDWEWKWGYDPFTWDNHTFLDPDNDGIQNIEEYKMADWQSNPFYPDMFIECDWMAQTPRFDRRLESPDGWTHEFYPESQAMIVERFNEHGITVHIDDGCKGGGGDIIPFDAGGEGYPMGDYSQEYGVAGEVYKKFFTEDRKGIFRYLAICYKGGWCHPQDDRNAYDCIFVPMGRKIYFDMAAASLTPRTKRIAQAVSILHELGHSCGFNPPYYHMYHTVFSWDRWRLGNFPDTNGMNVEDWDGIDYVSCMSYEYYFYSLFDYSDGSHGPYDNDDWGNLDLGFFQRSSPGVEGLSDERI
jgi:hypothetical protein